MKYGDRIKVVCGDAVFFGFFVRIVRRGWLRRYDVVEYLNQRCQPSTVDLRVGTVTVCN